MIIGIGTKNEAKVEAVKECLLNYNKIFTGSVMYLARDVKSGVSSQPKTLEETIKGAINRARRSFEDCSYSFGIESGLMIVPYTETGYMNICACAIYDGSKNYIGLSSAYEYPKKIIDGIFNENLNVEEALNKLNFTTNPKIGAAEGAIGIFTDGKITRKDYTKQAITNALIKISKRELFE
ncbi:MAG TPA: inosine/xanthosine triphosphatase [Allocoleopsis sp.]